MGKKAAQTWSNVNSDSPHGLRDKTHYMRKQVTRGASVSRADWCGKLHLYTVMSIFHTVCFSNWKVATRLLSRTPGDWAWVNLVGIRCNFLHGPRGIRPGCFLCQHWLGPVGNQEIQNKKDNPLLHVQPSKWGSSFFPACRGWEMTSGMRLDRMSDKGYLVFFPLDLIPVKTGYTRPLLKTAHVLLLYKNTQSFFFFFTKNGSPEVQPLNEEVMLTVLVHGRSLRGEDVVFLTSDSSSPFVTRWSAVESKQSPWSLNWTGTAKHGSWHEHEFSIVAPIKRSLDHLSEWGVI